MKDAGSGTDRIGEGFRRLALVAGVCLAAAAYIGLAFASDKVQRFLALGGADDGLDGIFVAVLVGAGFAVAGFAAGWGAIRVLGWVVEGFVNGRAEPNAAPPAKPSTPPRPRDGAVKGAPEQIRDAPVHTLLADTAIKSAGDDNPDAPIPPLLAETAARIAGDDNPDAAISALAGETAARIAGDDNPDAPISALAGETAARTAGDDNPDAAISAVADDDEKIEEEAQKVQKFHAMCKMAEKSVDGFYDPDDARRERGRKEFEELKLKALDLANEIEDDFYHGAAVQSVVSLCLRAAQIDEAKNLIGQIRDDDVKERAWEEVGEYE